MTTATQDSNSLSNWKKKTALFLTSQAITLFGSSVVQFALVWFVTQKTSSVFWVAMMTVCGSGSCWCCFNFKFIEHNSFY